MSESKEKLSYSKIKCFLQCRQRYVYTYIDKLAPKGKARALQVGDIVHQLLHKHFKGELTREDFLNLEQLVQKCSPENEEELTTEVAYEAAILVSGYIKNFRSDPLEHIPGETALEVDMGEFILTGRVDAWIRRSNSSLWREEHKTTAKMDGVYLSGLKGGLQGAIYDYLSEQLLQEKISGTVYNLLVKTKIPTYHRTYSPINRRAIERMYETVHGVWRDIKRGDFYPSSDCFSFNRECSYRALCEFDTPQVREAFYVRRVSPNDPPPTEELSNGV